MTNHAKFLKEENAMEKKIADIIQKFTDSAKEASDSAAVEKLRVAFLGKKGEIAELMKDL